MPPQRAAHPIYGFTEVGGVAEFGLAGLDRRLKGTGASTHRPGSYMRKRYAAEAAQHTATTGQPSCRTYLRTGDLESCPVRTLTPY